MQFEDFPTEVTGAAITSSRLLLAEHMAHQVHEGSSIASGMATFVAADILDGVILRKVDKDTPFRRIVDGVVDHLSVLRVMTEIYRYNQESRPYIGVLAMRAVGVGGLNTLHLAQTGEVTKGRYNQKSTNLATAAFGIAAATGNKRLTHATGLIAAAVAVGTAAAHLKNLGHVNGGAYREL